MGVFDFLKQLSRNEKEEVKEMEFLEIEKFIDSWGESTFDGVHEKLEDINKKIEKEKEKSKENIIALTMAELKNPNIPERAKHIMEGNRKMYAQKVELFLDKLILPDDFDDLLTFCESFNNSLDDFGKNTIRSYQVLQEFFGDEANAIATNIRESGELVKKAKKIVEKSGIERISKLKNKVGKVQKGIKRKEELIEKSKAVKEQLQKESEKIKEKGKTLKEIEEGERYQRFIDLINKKKTIKEEIIEMERQWWHIFSVIETALKKYERITLDDKIVRDYIKSSLQALLRDTELDIVNTLDKMKNAIIKGEIELKEKKKGKILQELIRLNKGYFESFVGKYHELDSKMNKIKLEIKQAKIIKEVEELKERVRKDNENIDITKTNMDEMMNELKEIDIDVLKKNVEKEVLRSIGKKVVII